MYLINLLASLLTALFATSASAGVLGVATNGFSAKQEIDIAASPVRVYEAVVGQVGEWWNPGHTYSGNGNNLSMETRVGGCFCEALPNSGGVEHMRIVYLQPGRVVRLSGGLGPLQEHGLNAVLTLSFKAIESGTHVTAIYNVGGYMANGFEKIASPVDQVLTEQWSRLKSFVETGKGAPTQAK
jgi:hypothetical protein